MKRSVIAVLGCLAAACGSEWHLPFSNANPTLPSNITIGSAQRPRDAKAQSPDPQATGIPVAPRNQGTRVWLVPAPAGDMLRMAREPQLWEKARTRVDVFSFYNLHAYHHDGFVCGAYCGPNTLDAFRTAVSGGMFKWLTDQGISLALEAGAVKRYACTVEKMRDMADGTNIPIANIKATGSSVAFVSLDKPFFSGTNPVDYPGFGGCELSLEQTAGLVKRYIELVAAAHQEVRVGIIEPYPAMSPDQIISAVLELERLGMRLPFLHVDMHLQHVVGVSADVNGDLRRIQEFCRARGIPFGVIVFGGDGRTSGGFTEDAWATMRLITAAVGVTDDLVLQSWAEDEPGNLNSRKYKPDTVPESNPATHAGQLLRMLEYLKIQPAP